ncbi:hypothetical protein AB6A40_002743 [Gnathostoma spinigerum]|uniref:Uncharacterized protein n=1 Tax=Gnathostoma spinigerum TaxID=75299 RepID=A0ABD6E7G4_9BILA
MNELEKPLFGIRISAKATSRMTEFYNPLSEALIQQEIILVASIVIAMALTKLFDLWSYTSRPKLERIKVDPKGYSSCELHLLHSRNALGGCMDGVLPRFEGITGVYTPEELFSQMNDVKETTANVDDQGRSADQLVITSVREYHDTSAIHVTDDVTGSRMDENPVGDRELAIAT